MRLNLVVLAAGVAAVLAATVIGGAGPLLDTVVSGEPARVAWINREQ